MCHPARTPRRARPRRVGIGCPARQAWIADRSASGRSRPGVWLLIQLPDVLDGDPVTESVEWVPALGMNLDLRLDGFAALMVALVAGIGVAVYAYACRTSPPNGPGSAGWWRC